MNPADATVEAADTREIADVRGAVDGHLKFFGIGVFPYDHPLMPAEPQGQAFLDARLNGSLNVRRWLRVEVAHAVTVGLGADGSLQVGRTGVAPITPQIVNLNWQAFQADGSTVRVSGRTDRAMIKLSRPGVDLAVGRQPIGFGTGLFFTPLDLVNPFTPATIDTEYKPGVDAVRLDVYRGVSSQASAVVAWAGPPAGSADAVGIDEALTAVVFGSSTVGSTDLGLFAGWVHRDVVLGATASGAIGPVGVHADAAFTVPTSDETPDEQPFVRAVIGADGRPLPGLAVSGELYVQTVGAKDAEGILPTLATDRYARGELWLAGRAYAGLAAQIEVTPLITAGAGGFLNLTDGSCLVAPSVSWSVAENADVAAGGYLGLGARPETPATPPGFGVKSEFGLYPAMVFVQGRSYF